METEGFTFRPSKQLEQNEILELLKKNFEMPPEYWRWKYIDNPTVDPSLNMVVEKDGKIIGCGCWLPRSLRISNKLELNSLMAAHVAIDQEFRKYGLGRKLIESIRTTRAFEKNDSVLILALILQAPTYKNYFKHITHHTQISDSTIIYTKLLTLRQLIRQIENINKKILAKPENASALSKLELSIRFRLIGAPPFVVRFLSKGIQLDEESSEMIHKKVTFTVKGGLMFIKEMAEGSRSITNLINGLIRRKIVLSGNPFRLYRLYKAYKLIRSSYQPKRQQ